MLLQQLITFCTVVDEGGFTRAADVLSMSQPAVSKQVKTLEQKLQAELLVRTGRQVSLTPAGELVYSYAKRIIHTVEELHGALENLSVPGYGRLSIGSVSTVAMFTLPELLGVYTREHPLVTVHVRTGTVDEVMQMVLRNEIDIGLVTVPLTHELLHTIPLFRDRILLVASPGTPWAGRSVVKPQELAQMPMIAYQRESKFRAYVDASFQAAGITPDVIMEFDSHEAVKAMVAAGFGVAMMPSSAVADDIEEGALVELKIAGFEELARITSLIIRRDRHQSPPVRAFLDLVRHTFPLARSL
ncbi:MAG: LysR family transcriptional regulator [Limnochordales bacterium]